MSLKTRIVNLLKEGDYPATDIATCLHANPNTVRRALGELCSADIVIRTDRVGGANIYGVNEVSDVPYPPMSEVPDHAQR